MSDCNHEFEIWRGRDICIICGEEKDYSAGKQS